MTDEEKKKREAAYREWLRRMSGEVVLEDPDAADDLPEEDAEGDDE